MTSVEFMRLAVAQVWQVTLLVMAVGVLHRLTARKRPHLAHVLWLVVLVKCVTPPVFCSPTGIFCRLTPELNFIERQHSQDAAGWFPATDAATAIHDANASGEWTMVAVGEHDPIDRNADAMAAHPFGHEVRREFDGWRVPVHESVGRAVPFAFYRSRWLIGFWLAGVAFYALLFAVRALIYFAQLRRTQTRVPDDLAARVRDHIERIGLRRRIRILLTSGRTGPAVHGVFRPVIVLPDCVTRGRTLDELEPILLHELLHIRRGDLWVSLLQLIVQAVWWFHPLVWLASRQVTREAERSCDEEVLAVSNCSPARYARSLLDVLELKQVLKPVPVFPGVKPVEITSQRLERIMTLGQGCQKQTPRWCRLVMLLLFAATLPGANFVTETGNPSNESPADGTVTADRTTATGTAALALIPDARRSVAEPMDPPTDEEVLDAVRSQIERQATVPPDGRTWPDVGDRLSEPNEQDRFKNVRIVKEKILDRIDEPRFYPLIGEARLHSVHFRCTVYFTTLNENGSTDRSVNKLEKHVVVIDKNHLECGDAKANTNRLNDVAHDLKHGTNPFQAKIEQSLSRQVSFEFNDESLMTAFRTIAKERAVNLVIDRRALDEAGLTGDEPVSIKIDDISLRSALDRVTESVNLVWLIDDEVIKVTSRSRAQPLIVRSYAVADLVVPYPDKVDFPERNDERRDPTAAEPGASTDEIVEQSRVFRADFEALTEVILATVTPDMWDNVGGVCSLATRESSLSLIVRHNAEGHKQIDYLLNQLRKLMDLQVSLELQSINVKDDEDATALATIHELTRNSAHPGIIMLDQETATEFQARLSNVGATFAERPTITIFSGTSFDYRIDGALNNKDEWDSVFQTPMVSADRRSVRMTTTFRANGRSDVAPMARTHDLRDGQTVLIDVTECRHQARIDANRLLRNHPAREILPRHPPADGQRRFLFIRVNILHETVEKSFTRSFRVKLSAE